MGYEFPSTLSPFLLVVSLSYLLSDSELSDQARLIAELNSIGPFLSGLLGNQKKRKDRVDLSFRGAERN